jgi:HK97 family phage prohead protease
MSGYRMTPEQESRARSHAVFTPEQAERARKLVQERARGGLKFVTATLRKVDTASGEGAFTAIVSTFGPPPDTANDVIAHGAYDQTLADWRSRGDWPAVWWMHDYEDPNSAIGVLTGMHVIEQGLLVNGQLDMNHERSKIVFEGMMSGRIKEFSIGYAVTREHYDNAADYNVLDVIEVVEVSVVFAGANRNTHIIDIKSDVVDESKGRWIAGAFYPYVTEEEEAALVKQRRAEDKRIEKREAEYVSAAKKKRDPEIQRYFDILDALTKDKTAERVSEPDVVDEFLKGFELLREVERAQEAKLEQAIRDVTLLPNTTIPGAAEEAERDRERREREAAWTERDDARKEAEANARVQADEARRKAFRENPNPRTPEVRQKPRRQR